MTMPDPRVREELEDLIEKAPPDRVQRLLEDIQNCAPLPVSTHKTTDRLQ